MYKNIHPSAIIVTVGLLVLCALLMIKSPGAPKQGPALHVLGINNVHDGSNTVMVIHIGIYTNDRPVEVFSVGNKVK